MRKSAHSASLGARCAGHCQALPSGSGRAATASRRHGTGVFAIASRARMRVGVPGRRRPASAAWRSSRTRSRGSTGSPSRSSAAPATAAGFADAAYAEAGAELVDDAWRGSRRRRQGRASRPRTRSGSCATGELLIAFLQPLDRPRPAIERLAAARRARVRDGVDPADHARAADGRAVVAGDRRRATRRCCSPPTRLPRFFPMLTTAAGTIAPGAGARARRRRRRAPGDRDRAAARRRRLGLRRAAGRARAGAVARRDVPRPRRRRRGDRGRLRARADGRGAGAAAGARSRSGSPTSTS